MTVGMGKQLEKDGKTEEEKQRKKMNYNAKEKNVTNFLKNTIISVNGATDDETISKYRKSIMETRELRKFIKDNAPTVEFKGDFYCTECGEQNKEVTLEFNPGFFWSDS